MRTPKSRTVCPGAIHQDCTHVALTLPKFRCLWCTQQIAYRKQIESDMAELHGWLEMQWQETRERMEAYEREDELDGDNDD